MLPNIIANIETDIDNHNAITFNKRKEVSFHHTTKAFFFPFHFSFRKTRVVRRIEVLLISPITAMSNV